MPIPNTVQSETAEWSRWLTPAVLVVAFGVLWKVIRPALSRLAYHLLEVDPDRANSRLFTLLESEQGRVRFRAYFDDAMTDLLAEIHMSSSALRSMQTAVEGIGERVTSHGEQLAAIAESVREVPRLSEAIDRMATSITGFTHSIGKELRDVNEQLVRIDERERERERELDRRHASVDVHPLRRAGEA